LLVCLIPSLSSLTLCACTFVLIIALGSVHELQEPSSAFYTPSNKPNLLKRLDELTEKVVNELKEQGFEGKMVKVERMLNMRFDGTDTSLMVLAESEGQKEGQEDSEEEDFLGAFRKAYKSEFGFLLDEKNVVVDDIKVCCQIHSFSLSLC
jgi:5-oxoprolinase (ATP-hydrolysing)